jgi:phosphoribosylformimino-5-aminoimidazole carboxamide ribotide isomerase
MAATDLAAVFRGEPLAALVYTDISRDGMLQGPNFAAMAEMKRVADCPVIASGGIATLDDVAQLAQLGLDGCIIGRAIYEGQVNLPEALAVARTQHAAAGGETNNPR